MLPAFGLARLPIPEEKKSLISYASYPTHNICVVILFIFFSLSTAFLHLFQTLMVYAAVGFGWRNGGNMCACEGTGCEESLVVIFEIFGPRGRVSRKA